MRSWLSLDYATVISSATKLCLILVIPKKLVKFHCVEGKTLKFLLSVGRRYLLENRVGASGAGGEKQKQNFLLFFSEHPFSLLPNIGNHSVLLIALFLYCHVFFPSAEVSFWVLAFPATWGRPHPLPHRDFYTTLDLGNFHVTSVSCVWKALGPEEKGAEEGAELSDSRLDLGGYFKYVFPGRECQALCELGFLTCQHENSNKGSLLPSIPLRNNK